VVTGRTLPKPIWVVQLRGAKKQHLVAFDEFGEPYKRTLCRKTYTLEDRTYSKKIKSLSGVNAPHVSLSWTFGCIR
jgi:hypothetical protein